MLNTPQMTIRKKWRPSLLTVICLVVGTLMALPLIGLMTARLTSNQFVRETESSLISQSAIMARLYAAAYSNRRGDTLHGQKLSDALIAYYGQKFHPKQVLLTSREDTIQSERPDPVPIQTTIDPIYQSIGAEFAKVAREAQKTSLAGYQAVDYRGSIIGGTGKLSGSFADLPEIQAALRGEVVSLLRDRSDKNQRHPLASISRDTGFRVLVAMPVIVEDHVVGAVYLTRTPSNLGSFLYRERQTLMLVAGSVLLAASLVGLLLWRLLAGPIKELQKQSERVASGQIATLEPIGHYGTKETAGLGQSILGMSAKLKQRSDSLQSYTAHVTHELKSPLTSIIGAVELLDQNSDKMGDATRQNFYKNIRQDGDRMTRLLDDLRRFAASDMNVVSGFASLKAAVETCQADLPQLGLHLSSPTDAALPMAQQNLDVILVHLAQNAAQHGAQHMVISQSGHKVSFQDDGLGISEANLDKVFQPFFTTSRNTGGTGMGLAIVQSIVQAYGGVILAEPCENGARFVLEFPA